MKISVVVPAFNEEKLLAGSLAAIRRAMAAFEAAGWAAELIVCDNNSTDRTAAIAAAAGALVVFEPVNQIARARNSGARRATGDWLVFVDADSYPPVELFRDVVEQIQGGRCAAGGATVALEQGGPHDAGGAPPNAALRAIVGWWNLVSRTFTWGAGSFIFCETALFRAVGGFNESFYAAEEIDLFRRLKRATRRTNRTVVILHRHPLPTSARKAHLYSFRDALRFYTRIVLTAGRSLRNREGAFVWYDGRR